jgi:hypothetical protein
MASALLVFLALSVWVAFSAAADGQGGEHCRPSALCGSMNISFPFEIVPEEDAVTNCSGGIEFQVRCRDNIPYLGYYQTEYYMQILSIFYDNSSMVIAETPDHNGTRYQELDCHILTSNTTSELGLPFSISPANQNLIFYNCTKPQSLGRGLVEAKCRGNMYVRVGPERSDDKFRSYFVEGCNSFVKPVLGRSVKMESGNYENLVRGGFLATWQQQWQPPSGNLTYLVGTVE